MSEHLNLFDFFEQKASAAWEDGRLITYGVFAFAKFFILFPAALIPIMMFSVPCQLLLEAIYWLQNAEFVNYSWAWYLGPTRVAEMTNGPDLGLNIIKSWALKTWISLPFSISGFIAYRIIVPL